MEIKTEVRGAHSGQIDITMYIEEGGKVAAYLDYSVYEDEPSVQHLFVQKEYRRQGHGTALLRALQKEFPDTEIDLGMLTQDGSKLIDTLKFATITDEALAKKARFLQRIRDHLEAIYKLSPDEIRSRAYEIERLQDMELDLETELEGKSITKRIIESKTRAPLYHALTFKNAAQALKDNKLLATSTQRFWSDGLRKKENWDGYDDSFWMKGISLTRDIRYALSWNDIVFVLNGEKLRHHIKIVPFAWNYHFSDDPDSVSALMGAGRDYKKEKEEFAVIKSDRDAYKQEDGQFDITRFRLPEGSIDGLESLLLGIVADRKMIEGDHAFPKEHLEKTFPQIFQHPKFMGFV